jgi:hypothetical protein
VNQPPLLAASRLRVDEYRLADLLAVAAQRSSPLARGLLRIAAKRALEVREAAGAGVVAEDVERAELALDAFDGRVDARASGDVDLSREAAAGERGRELRALPVDVQHRDVGALSARRRRIASPIPDAPPVTAATFLPGSCDGSLVRHGHETAAAHLSALRRP